MSEQGSIEPPLDVRLCGLLAAGGSGVPRYATRLTRALDEVAGEFQGLALTLLTTAAGAEAVNARRLAVRALPFRSRTLTRGPARVAAEQIVAATRPGDLLHFFDVTGPVLRPSAPFVATVHDASVVHSFRRRRHAYKRWLWPWAFARARRVVAVSQFAADEATRHFGVPAERLAVIRSGPGFSENPRGETGPARVEPPFLLFVGDFHSSKNLPFLVRAFARSELQVRLVLAGRPDEGLAALRREVERSPARDRVSLLHDVRDGELDALYRSATALVLPSRYEGFGFTPLEAMARGCPVVASDIPPLREISGDGALLVPLDEAAWATALRRVSSEAEVREELRARGAKTVARYSWAETARGLCRLFLDVGTAA